MVESVMESHGVTLCNVVLSSLIFARQCHGQAVRLFLFAIGLCVRLALSLFVCCV